MKKDKLKIYCLELLLIVILFFALFASRIFTRSVLTVVVFSYMLLVKMCLKKRKVSSINKKHVNILMIIFSGIYLGIFYLLGIYSGFVKAKVLLSVWSIFRFIIPLAVIIISSEIIRNIFLSQEIFVNRNGRKVNLSLVFTYISMVLIDLLIYTGVYDLTNLDDFLMAMGFVLFASLSCNLLYNYISTRFDSKGIIIYRLVTVLFMYIIPIVPDVYIFFRSFLRMLYPFIIYVIIDGLYGKKNKIVSYGERRSELIGNSILLVIVSLLIMLISCQFKYGILVIGSRSMTGTIDKGDAILFEKYERQPISKGQVIIFNYNDVKTVHRVVDIRIVDGEYRYYTKGDANKNIDAEYTTRDEIVGLVDLKIKYVGYPTLWFRSLFSK